MTDCPHRRMRSIAVFLPDNGRPACVALTVQCHQCGQPFEFVGIQSSETVLVSEDRREVRILILESDEGEIHSDDELERLTQKLLDLDSQEDATVDQTIEIGRLTRLIERYEAKHYPLDGDEDDN